MTWVAAAVAGGTALYGGISANQANQQQKGLQGKALAAADKKYADLGNYRTMGLNALTNPQTFDFGADYAGAPKYRGVNDPLVNQANAAQSKSLNDLSNGPDRIAMVKQALADLDAENAPRLKAGIRGIGQDAARLGRIGSGMVTTSIGDLASDVERDRNTKANALIRDAIEGNQNDKYRTASLAGDIGSQAYGRAAGERGYEDTLSLNDVQNRVQQRDREQNAANTQFGRGLSLSTLGAGFDPSQTYLNVAQQQQQQANANQAGINDFIGALGQNIANRPPKTPKKAP